MAVPTAQVLDVTPDASTRTLPRILCLHGGGVNAAIYRAQLRTFLGHAGLRGRFRFVFAQAPHVCDAGEGVHPVYDGWGPFRRWFRWLPEHPAVEEAEGRRVVLGACAGAMEEDDTRGGVGEWVAVMGFSQGAKVAVSLLYEMQVADERGEGAWVVGGKRVRWLFGLVFAGRAPLVALSEQTEGFVWCQKAGGLPDEADLDAIMDRPEMKLRVPTVHVHGLKDVGLGLHRRLVDEYCAPLSTTVVEWDGPHRVPIKSVDVDRVVRAIVEIADEYGV